MKIYKNFDEKIKGKVWGTIEKILRKFLKKFISFKYFAEVSKKN